MTRVRRGVILCTIVSVTCSASSARSPVPLKRHWRETDTETLWTVRYTNCDYGYYVRLASGVVAHGTHSPNPNHGFIVSLVDVGTTAPVSWEHLDRFMYFDASYDAAERPTAEEFSKRALLRAKPGTVAPWSGLVALKSHTVSKDGKAIDESIVAVRAGIVYTASMHTTGSAYTADEMGFQALVRGFHLLPLPRGQCSNG